MSQSALAQELTALGLKYNQQQVERTESGKRPIRLNEAISIAQLFGLRLEQIVDQEASAPSKHDEAVNAARRVSHDLDRHFTAIEDMRATLEEDRKEIQTVYPWLHDPLLTHGEQASGASETRAAASMVESSLHLFIKSLRTAENAVVNDLDAKAAQNQTLRGWLSGRD